MAALAIAAPRPFLAVVMEFVLWVGFVAVILAMLAVDLGVFHRRSHVVPVSEAAIWTTVWVILALLFNVAVFFLYEHHVLGIGLELGHELTGEQAGLQFFTGYVIEKSLSLDNIFVIAIIFAYFGVPSHLQHRVLFYGILGALVMRGVMIAAGAALIHRFSWITYVFGALLIVTAVKMLLARPEHLDPDKNPLVRITRRLYPVSATFEGERFFTRVNRRRAVTPLLLTLLVVESTDLLFAVDSIPAIFAVTHDPFLVFTSNVLAILGLRSLYFVLAYVGVKMLLAHHYPIPTLPSLAIISGILGVGVLASIIAGQRDQAALQAPPMPPPATERPEKTWRQLRRIAVAVTGAIVLLIGLAMIVLPGRAIVVIPAGLAILAMELLWARKLLGQHRTGRIPAPNREAPTGLGAKRD